MRLSTATVSLASELSHKEAIKIIKESGFDAFDLSLTEMLRNKESLFNGDDYIKYAEELKSYADGIGIACNQAHAPFHSSTGKADEDEYIFGKIVKSMEIAAKVGADIIVVHPKQHLPYADNVEELFELNVDFYNRLIPYAEEYGIKVATENMWQYNKANKSIIDSTCSRPREFCRYIDAINSGWIVACLDLGHAALVGENVGDFIRKLGKKRLKSLHVHDNNLINDSHELPLMQKMDFAEITKALGEIGYEGDFTYEVQGIYKQKPKELLKATTTYMAAVGRYLIGEIEKARENL